MATIVYTRLVALTAGTLVYLFLLALILGHRRPRRLERVLFFLSLALFLFYGGELLEANTQIQQGVGPQATVTFAQLLTALGLLFLPPLIWHFNYEYRKEFPFRETGRAAAKFCAILLYFVAGGALAWVVYAVARGTEFSGVLSRLLSREFAVSLLVASGSTAFLAMDTLKKAGSETERWMAKWIGIAAGMTFVVSLLSLARLPGTNEFGGAATATVILLGVVPGSVFIDAALRRNFLEYGAQRNLVYGLSVTFLALLYLALVRRVSGWLEPYFPREATAGFLLFILIFLFEPLERLIGPALHRRIQSGMEGLQRLTAELQEQARQGSLTKLREFAERRVREEFGLAAVRISIPADPNAEPLKSPGGLGHVARIAVVKEGKQIGLLEAATTGAYLTGETSAALEFLAEQLPGLADLAKAIEAKIELERELAERERLALLGQMAASVSHNLRNPLSSMKTILQVQLENPGLPFDARHDCALVVAEIDRMSAKLTQLLKYSKPSVNGRRVGIVAVARQTAALLGRDAEKRNVRMVFDQPAGEIEAIASEEAVGEILSNLLVNAIEAQPKGGSVLLRISRRGESAAIEIEDEGPGIPAELRSKMFRPFFTTKATGTGLGLSIVARRAEDLGGTVECESPVRDGRGAKFRVTLPVAAGEGRMSDAENPDRG
ncbi:MAG TPA: ATP-binding protein [Verrucomicrobiae bacterium]|nr:ATP-binding protein [Verrucomicrobiae bacterium]